MNKEYNNDYECRFIKRSVSDFGKIFQNAFIDVPCAILLTDIATDSIIAANSAACELYGYSCEEILEMKAGELSADTDKPAGSAGPYHVKKDGTVFPAEISTRIFGHDGQDIRIVFVQDVSGRMQAEEERHLIRKIIECIREGVIVYDRDLRYQLWNPFMKKITGMSGDEVIGRHPLDVFPFLAQSGVIEGLKKALEGEYGDIIDFRYDIPETGRSGWAACRIAPLYNISGDITGVLEAVHDITERKAAEESLLRKDAMNRTMTANIADVVCIMDTNGIIRYVSTNIERLFGYHADEMIGDTPWGYIHPDDRGRIEQEFTDLLKEDGKITCATFRYRHGNGEYGVAELTAVNLVNDEHINGILINYHDITSRKKKEEEIRYLSYHDSLTGLYNRTFFEEEVRRVNTPRQCPISFIIADINGLKFANDSFGHDFGDKLLIGFTKILRSCLRQEDVIARWGGDEFVILLPSTPHQTAVNICERIKSSAEKTVIDPVRLSVALGISTKECGEQSFAEIIKSAENQMYRNKLLEAKSGRSHTVTSLLRTMYEMDYETEENDRLLRETAVMVGRKLELMPQEIEELKLLALLHDIGKLGVSREIVMKPGRLTGEEMDEIKRHSEIGYRIAESTPGLAHISKYILSIHERWDGKGYPQGLKGSAIPKLSRIASLLDAYDAMTGIRTYRKPVSPAEAIEEIRRNSRTQFDPYLVEVFAGAVADTLISCHS